MANDRHSRALGCAVCYFMNPGNPTTSDCLLYIAGEQEGCTALMHSAVRGHLTIVKTFIEVKADVNIQDEVSGLCDHA